MIEVLVRHRNAYARVQNSKTEMYGATSISILEWETLEYIIEHADDDASMIQLSERLAIPPSTLSKCSKTLCDCGLAAKYQMVGNRKNVILKPTTEGLSFYKEHSANLAKTIFGAFFSELDSLSDEDLEHVANALEHIAPSVETSQPEQADHRYIKLE